MGAANEARFGACSDANSAAPGDLERRSDPDRDRSAGAGWRTRSDGVGHRSIRVVDEPDLDTTTRVDPDGTINFPYVGRIKAAGLTEDELEQAIGRRLVQLQILADPRR